MGLYIVTLRFGPIPFDFILKNRPVEVLKEELLIAVVVETPTVDARTEWETPPRLLNPHKDASWNRPLASFVYFKNYISLPDLQRQFYNKIICQKNISLLGDSAYFFSVYRRTTHLTFFHSRILYCQMINTLMAYLVSLSLQNWNSNTSVNSKYLQSCHQIQTSTHTSSKLSSL